MGILKMSLHGQPYYGGHNALQNTKDRYYQKYVKPVLDKQVNPLEQFAGAVGGIFNAATGQNPITGYKQGKDVFQIVDTLVNMKPPGYHPALDKPPRWM